MKRIVSLIRREPVLSIALLAALASCFLCPPDKQYIGYIDLRTLALLYSLMVVVAGLRTAGVFTALSHNLCAHASSVRMLAIILVGLCFFSAMLITNDVALLTFVPFAVIVLGMAGRSQDLIRIIVLQTVAANLGSMLTPVGNPQNLYIYSYYDLPFSQFISICLPTWLLSLVLILLGCFSLPKTHLHIVPAETVTIQRRKLCIYAALFAVCLLTVVRVLTWPFMLGIVLVVLLIFDRRMLLKADFMLLLTFVAFFIFAGNLARVDSIRQLLETLLSGRVYGVSLAASQIISNVPAALLLSSFTTNAQSLLLGVNIGGLGTPIASLASLISLKLYVRSGEGTRSGRYLMEFTAVNVLLLLLLSAFVWMLKMI